MVISLTLTHKYIINEISKTNPDDLIFACAALYAQQGHPVLFKGKCKVESIQSGIFKTILILGYHIVPVKFLFKTLQL